jgi:hypothetical protein
LKHNRIRPGSNTSFGRMKWTRCSKIVIPG